VENLNVSHEKKRKGADHLPVPAEKTLSVNSSLIHQKVGRAEAQSDKDEGRFINVTLPLPAEGVRKKPH